VYNTSADQAAEKIDAVLFKIFRKED